MSNGSSDLSFVHVCCHELALEVKCSLENQTKHGSIEMCSLFDLYKKSIQRIDTEACYIANFTSGVQPM